VTPLIIPVSSRTGALVAIAFFAVIFGTLGFLVARRLARGGGGAAAHVTGLSLFAAPMVLLYATSLAGFYDVELGTHAWRLRPLVPALGVSVPAASIRRVEQIPAYRGTWRLRILADDGVHLSASARRDVADAARARLRGAGAAARRR
jgi:hypothetical protein